MVHILLCDDDLTALKMLGEMVTSYYRGRCHTALFADPREVADYVANHPRIELAIFDILMPYIPGTALARQIRSNGYQGEIAFLTSSNEYAAESYRVSAMDYLLKPYNIRDVRALLERFDARRNIRRSGIDIVRKSITRRIPFHELIYVEVIQHHLHFHLADGELLRIYAPLSDYSDALLAHGSMGQCHRSYIVNMDFIESCTMNEAIMPDGVRIPITEKYRSFHDSYLRYTFGRMGI